MTTKPRTLNSRRAKGTNGKSAGGREFGPIGAPAVDAVSDRLCQRVRDMRQKKGWTLEQMSAACGVSRSMLSQVERRKANPTLAVAYRIAQALGMSLGALVETPRATPVIDVIRADDRTYHYRSDRYCKIRTLSPLNLEKDVEFYEVRLHPGGALRSAPHFRGTREFLTVQAGTVRLSVAGDRDELHLGDSAFYPADVRHSLENPGKEDALLFLVVIYQE